jgi:hypothetical protein
MNYLWISVSYPIVYQSQNKWTFSLFFGHPLGLRRSQIINELSEIASTHCAISFCLPDYCPIFQLSPAGLELSLIVYVQHFWVIFAESFCRLGITRRKYSTAIGLAPIWPDWSDWAESTNMITCEGNPQAGKESMGATLQPTDGHETLQSSRLFRWYLLNSLNPEPRIGLKLSECTCYLTQRNEYKMNAYFLVPLWDRFLVKFQWNDRSNERTSASRSFLQRSTGTCQQFPSLTFQGIHNWSWCRSSIPRPRIIDTLSRASDQRPLEQTVMCLLRGCRSGSEC